MIEDHFKATFNTFNIKAFIVKPLVNNYMVKWR
jgi:hypothetical protein